MFKLFGGLGYIGFGGFRLYAFLGAGLRFVVSADLGLGGLRLWLTVLPWGGQGPEPTSPPMSEGGLFRGQTRLWSRLDTLQSLMLCIAFFCSEN